MIKSRSCLSICAVLLLSIGFAPLGTAVAASSPAEDLMKVLPDDVLGFVATSGGDSLEADFRKSLLGRMWYDPGVKTFRDSIKTELLTKLEQEMGESDAAGTINTVESMVKLALSRPIILGAAKKAADDGPPVYGFAILDAGQRKDELVSALSKLESYADDGDIVDITVGSAKMRGPKDGGGPPLYWGWVGDYFVIGLNDPQGSAIKNLSAPRPTVPGCLTSVQGNGDALAAYCDVQGTIGIVKAVLSEEATPEDMNLVVAALKQLGLDNIKGAGTRVGFAGPDLVSNSLLEMPSPRTGLFANLKPINMSIFDMVDAGAMNANALNCDLGGMYDTVLGTIETVAGEDFAEVEQAIAEVESELKIKIRQALLQSLSGEMVFYALPAGLSAQSPMGGFVFIAGLNDAKLWEDTMTAMGEFAAEKSEGMVQVSSQVQDGRTVHTWAVMPLAMAQIMPTWTVVGDKVVIGSSPVICTRAVEQVGSGTKSIRGTEGFKRATAGLPANLISLRYSDSKLQLTQLMTGLQQFWPMATMFATKAELKLPMILPNLSHIIEDVGPSSQYSWFDDRGLRSRYRGAGIEPSLGCVAGVAIGMGALGMGALMPALPRTRQIAFRMVSGTNLSVMGKAMLIYANDYDDKFPPNLNVLLEKGLITAKTLESKSRPDGYDGPNFIYISGQDLSMYPGNIVAYENPEFRSDGVNVLFLDSHVEWMKPDNFLRELEETNERLGRQMPEIKFKR
jgi:prepilin-type processing-associated H-X9-DG protein